MFSLSKPRGKTSNKHNLIQTQKDQDKKSEFGATIKESNKELSKFRKFTLCYQIKINR